MAGSAFVGDGDAARCEPAGKTVVLAGYAEDVVAEFVSVPGNPMEVAAGQSRRGRADRRIDGFVHVEDNRYSSFSNSHDGIGAGVAVTTDAIGFQEHSEGLLPENLAP
jgi:hypothetical protein